MIKDTAGKALCFHQENMSDALTGGTLCGPESMCGRLDLLSATGYMKLITHYSNERPRPRHMQVENDLVLVTHYSRNHEVA